MALYQVKNRWYNELKAMEEFFMSEKKLLKSEKLRIKNDKLRAQGVDLEKRWGKK